MSDIPPREIILAKAGELFHRKGYSSVSIEEVIAASGLPKSEFYRAYSDKSALGQAWLERLTKRMRIMHETFMERPGERERRLKKYFFSMRSWVEANGWRACQFANTAACIDAEAEPEMAYLIDQYKRAQRKFFIELVGTLVDAKDAQRLGTAVFLLYSGAMTEAQNLKATWPFEDGLAAAEQLCGVRPDC
ncbi:TetR/AcrR family transcriptional regulator [Coraliomargarita algicola]|uniref:TetR/AcrR family transcriptional regulator n=1 Tax=Coraliomargarita algicola TaxID=3092156 RepID=A0ABZ0RG69_9BACT|nr:TetR/AcrR family transcriptional regulator [Coraliomargarita sp. J2-16]WPJ94088.1 TetR/AcrR family transcriptional regulator [Coraliomargarita sp. J2-16]